MRKQMLSNPIRTKYDFAPGGDMKPIQTRASGLPVAGYSTFGLPAGNVNRTSLGAYRMGDQDGIAPASAIYPGDIFAPMPSRDRQYTQVTFENIGNRAFQPEDNGKALQALLSRLGEQKFKAQESAPFDDYFATQRLARDVERASRTAGLEDYSQSREIMRNIADTRRKQAEEDFLRRMLDAGMSVEDAQDEIENVKRAAALQEARKPEDRLYQSKLLLTRLANSRGLLSKVKEPLSSSGAIENPTPSQEMAALMGRPGEGFGSAPLDMARKFLTPEYYRRFLRRSNLTQGVADEMTAAAQLASEGEQFASLPMLQGRERELALEQAKESLARRIENVKKVRVMITLPPILFGENVLNSIYDSAGKKPGDTARFQKDDIQEMSGLKLFLAINQALALDPDKIRVLRNLIQGQQFREVGVRGGDKPLDTLRDTIRVIARNLNDDRDTIMIPFSNISRGVTTEEMARALEMFRGLDTTEIRGLERQATVYYNELDAVFNDPAQGKTRDEFLTTVSGRTGAVVRRAVATDASAVPREVNAGEDIGGGENNGVIAAALAGGGGGGGGGVVAGIQEVGVEYPPLPKGINSMKKADWEAWAGANGFRYTTVADMKMRYENRTFEPL